MRDAQFNGFNEMLTLIFTSSVKELHLVLGNFSRERLESLLKVADDAYYNDGTNLKLTSLQKSRLRTVFSDRKYDICVDYLVKQQPLGYYARKIGASVMRVKEKVNLPFHMGSLDKVKPNSIEGWLRSNPGPYILSDKEDGNSGGAVIANGKISLYTRGDGTRGIDISHLIPYIQNFPKKITNIQVRGELIMSEKAFHPYLEEKANARNMVAGIINSKEVVEAIKGVDFIAYELIKPRMKPSKQFEVLKDLGFTVPWYKVYKTLDQKTLSSLLEQRKKKSKYAIDGIVITQDVLNPVNDSGNPKWSVAFKDPDLINTAETPVLDVKWQVSKHKYLKPVVIVEPQRLDGALIQKLTGFNAKFIVENKIGKGAVVKIQRSGEVIPHIMEVITPAKKPSLPKDIHYEWTGSKVDIFIPDAENREDYQIKKLTAFFRIIGVKEVSEGIIAKLYHAGLTTVASIIKASVSELKCADSVQDKKANTIRSQIDAAVSECVLPTLMYASGCFSRELGEKRFETICEALPNVLKYKASALYDEVKSLHGFSEKTTTAFVDAFPCFQQFLKDLPKKVKVVNMKSVKVQSSLLSKYRVVFTGFRQKAWEQLIEANGGQVQSCVTNTTNVVVAKDIDTASSKAAKAKTLGIKVVSKDMFENLLKRKHLI